MDNSVAKSQSFRDDDNMIVWAHVKKGPTRLHPDRKIYASGWSTPTYLPTWWSIKSSELGG
jgi:hypothetical protein